MVLADHLTRMACPSLRRAAATLHQRQISAFRDTMVCINIQATLAIVLWTPMMVETLTARKSAK